MIRKGSVILSAVKPKPEISKDKKLKRAGTTGFDMLPMTPMEYHEIKLKEAA